MGWVVIAMPWERPPVPTVQEEGWAPGPVWTGVEKGQSLAFHWVSNADLSSS